MSAMSINFGVDENCFVTDQLTQYFVERAKGGVGMMLVGGGGIHPGGQELVVFVIVDVEISVELQGFI